jgi:hypothetical protein
MADYSFPNPNVDPKEKNTAKYILQYGKAMNHHFNKNGFKMLYNDSANYRKIIQFYQGENPISTFQRRLDCWNDETGGSEGFVNINWQQLNFAYKFINIIVEKAIKAEHDIIATPIDPTSVIERSKRKNMMKAVMDNKDLLNNLGQSGIKVSKDQLGFDPANMPETPEELDIYMEMSDKDELALHAEIACEIVFNQNNFEQIRTEYLRYVALVGVCGVELRNTKDGFTKMKMIPVESLIISNSTTEDFRDKKYGGYVENITFSELKIAAGNQFNDEQYNEIYEKHASLMDVNVANNYQNNYVNNNYGVEKMVKVLVFYFKSYDEHSYEKKKDRNGNRKMYKTSYGRGSSEEYKKKYAGEREIIKDGYENVYEGRMILGSDFIYNWGPMNDTESKKDSCRETTIPIHMVAPNMINGKVVSFMYSMMPIFEEIQINWLQFQHAISKYIPDGQAIDIDSLIEAPLGKGGAQMKPKEVMDMFFKTGILVYKGSKLNGANPNALPVRPIVNSNIEKATGFLNNMLTLLNVLREQSGINSAIDASTPAPDALVGTQNLALQGSENALGFLYRADKSMLKSLANSAVLLTQNLVKRKKVTGLTKSMGTNSVQYWEVNKDICLKDYAIDISARPTQVEWNDFYLTLKDALAKGQIDGDDYADIMRVKNLKLASQLLKVSKKKRAKQKQEADQANIQAQAQANQDSAVAIEQAAQATLTLEYKLKKDFELSIRKEDANLLHIKYGYEGQLKGVELQSKENQKHIESKTKIVTKAMDAEIQSEKNEVTKQKKATA